MVSTELKSEIEGNIDMTSLTGNTVIWAVALNNWFLWI